MEKTFDLDEEMRLAWGQQRPDRTLEGIGFGDDIQRFYAWVRLDFRPDLHLLCEFDLAAWSSMTDAERADAIAITINPRAGKIWRYVGTEDWAHRFERRG